VIGFYQEFKAERRLHSLLTLDVPQAKVIRDGTVAQIAAEELVPGDVVVLEEGMSIPADLRLVEAMGLKTTESVLTGESKSISKSTEAIRKKNVAIGDMKNMGFMATAVVSGRGKGVVVKIGTKTEAGKIADRLTKAKVEISFFFL